MRKILIVSHAFELGGAEKALLGLLENLNRPDVQVDLFLLRHQGELMPHIPAHVHLLPESPAYSCMAVPITSVLKRGRIGLAFCRLYGKLKAKLRIKQLGFKDSDVELEYSHKYTAPLMPVISGEEYDLAISFLTPHYYVTEKVKAKKKLAWIHTDYSTVQVDRTSQLPMWAAYDYIASISPKVTESFLAVFPELRNKTIEIQNMMPVEYIRQLSRGTDVSSEMPEDGCIKLLSIGRFCRAKNFDNVPEICSLIRNAGLNVIWYLIGYGGDERLIRERIAAYGMEEAVIILGKKENPYPYIQACDVYVQPSRYEGKCVSVIEAQMLHKPVVIAAYTTAHAQLRDGFDGIILPMDNASFAAGMVRVLIDKARTERLTENTKQADYSMAEEITNLLAILA